MMMMMEEFFLICLHHFHGHYGPVIHMFDVLMMERALLVIITRCQHDAICRACESRLLDFLVLFVNTGKVTLGTLKTECLLTLTCWCVAVVADSAGLGPVTVVHGGRSGGRGRPLLRLHPAAAVGGHPRRLGLHSLSAWSTWLL